MQVKEIKFELEVGKWSWSDDSLFDRKFCCFFNPSHHVVSLFIRKMGISDEKLNNAWPTFPVSRERLHPSKRCQKPVHKTCTMTHREVEHVPAIRKFINSLQTIENLSQIIDGSSNSHFSFANIWFSFPRNENTTQLPRFSVWPKLTIFLCFSYFHFLAWASCVYIASKRSHYAVFLYFSPR